MVQVLRSVWVKPEEERWHVPNQRGVSAPPELESQFILRLPAEHAATVRRAVQSRRANLKDGLTAELQADGRHGIVRVDRVPLAARLLDMPCVLESLKTVDKKTFYKTADICQMLECSVDGELYPTEEEPAPPATTDVKTPSSADKKKDKRLSCINPPLKSREKKFIGNHGISLPLKNVRTKRFRKTAKKNVQSSYMEKEVKRLLSEDAKAVRVRWEVVAEGGVTDPDNHGSSTSLDISSPGTSGCKQSRGLTEIERRELWEMFKDVSSSSSDECKLNEADAQQPQENEGPNQIAVEIQKQIDNLKGELQETQEHRKLHEALIVKIETLALKTFIHNVLDDIKQQKEREKEQLASLQEQLETLREK